MDRADRWSDIDLAFGIAGPARLPEVLQDWTSAMHDLHGAGTDATTSLGRIALSLRGGVALGWLGHGG